MRCNVEWIIGCTVFIAGLLFGSFLNVCIYRIPRGNFWGEKNSYCPHCRTTLKWYDMF
ncbi:MAG: prepilin peptidase, partial [Clostridia bacterium]|nr:prepilin peptidase [Clostridia bacterium]